MSLSRFKNYLLFEKEYSPHTVKAYLRDLETFLSFVETEFEIGESQVDYFHVRAWIVDLMQRELTPRTINRKLSSLRTYYKFLKKAGLRQKDPTLKIISPKGAKRLPSVVQSHQLKLLFEEVDFPQGYEGVRDRLILQMIYSTGLRNSELVGLKISDVDFRGRQLKVLGKGGKERIIPVLPELLEAMQSYLILRKQDFPEIEEDSFFLSNTGRPLYPRLAYSIVRKYLTQVTTSEQKGPHVLRHSFATHLSDGGADLSAIKELLGHSTLASTEVYLHNSIAKLKEVYKKAHPKSGEGEE